MNDAIIDVTTDPWLAAVGDRGITRVFSARTIFMQEGEVGDTLYFVREGHGKIFSSNEAGREIVTGTFGPGDMVGGLSLDGGLRSASAMTLERTICVVVTVSVVLDLIAAQPRLALIMIGTLIALVRSTSESVKSFALENVYGRVVRLLLKEAEPSADGWIVRERMTQQSIADRVGSSREMVSRILRDLERGGYLSTVDRHIAISRKPPLRW